MEESKTPELTSEEARSQYHSLQVQQDDLVTQLLAVREQLSTLEKVNRSSYAKTLTSVLTPEVINAFAPYHSWSSCNDLNLVNLGADRHPCVRCELLSALRTKDTQGWNENHEITLRLKHLKPVRVLDELYGVLYPDEESGDE